MTRRILILFKNELRIQGRPLRLVPLLLVSAALSMAWVARARLPEWQGEMELREFLYKLKNIPPVAELYAPADVVDMALGGLFLAGFFLAGTLGLLNGLEIGGRERRQGTIDTLGIRPCTGGEIVAGRFLAASAILFLITSVILVAQQVAFPFIPIRLQLFRALTSILVPVLFLLALGMAVGAVFVRPLPAGIALVFGFSFCLFILVDVASGKDAGLWALLEPAFLFTALIQVSLKPSAGLFPGYAWFDILAVMKSLGAAGLLLLIASAYQKVYRRELSRLRFLEPGRAIPTFQKWLAEWIQNLLPEPARSRSFRYAAAAAILLAATVPQYLQFGVANAAREEFDLAKRDFNAELPAREGNLDILREARLDVRLRRFSRIEAEAHLTLEGPPGGADRILLGLNPGLAVRSASDASGHPLPFERKGHRLTVPLALGEGEQARLRIRYGGRLRTWFQIRFISSPKLGFWVHPESRLPRYLTQNDPSWIYESPVRLLYDESAWYPSPAFVRVRRPAGRPDAAPFRASLRIRSYGSAEIFAPGIRSGDGTSFETRVPVSSLTVVAGNFEKRKSPGGALLAAPAGLHPDPQWETAMDECTALAERFTGWAYGPPQFIASDHYSPPDLFTAVFRPAPWMSFFQGGGRLSILSRTYIMAENYSYNRRSLGFWETLRKEDPLLLRRISLLRSLWGGYSLDAVNAAPELVPFFRDAYGIALYRLASSFCKTTCLPSWLKPKAAVERRDRWWLASTPLSALGSPGLDIEKRSWIADVRGRAVWVTLCKWLGPDRFRAVRSELETLPGPVSLDDFKRVVRKHSPLDLGRALDDLLDGPLPEISLSSVRESLSEPGTFVVTVESKSDAASFAQVILKGARDDVAEVMIPVMGPGSFSAEARPPFVPRTANLGGEVFRLVGNSTGERVVVQKKATVPG